MTARRLALVAPLVVAAACGPRVDVARAVAARSVATGWSDVGSAAGRNRIVPTVAFTLRNMSAEALPALQVNAVFHRAGDPSEWTTGFVPAAARALAPGAETPTLAVSGAQGYTGSDDRDALLRNSRFVDASVDVFVKAGASRWVKLGAYPIARRIVMAGAR